MSFLDKLFGRKKKEVVPQPSNIPEAIPKEPEIKPEVKPETVLKEAEIIPREQVLKTENEKKEQIAKPESEKKVIINYDNEKLSQILTELKALYVLLRDHDNHLTMVDNNVIEHISELMTRKKIVSEEMKLEVEAILKTSSNRKEALERLIAIGIPQSTAYKYTEFLIKQENEKKEILMNESEKKDSLINEK